VDELFLKCCRILGLEETVTEKEIEEAFEGERKRCEAGRAAGGDPEPWERLKEITWARETLLDHLTASETPDMTKQEGSPSGPERGERPAAGPLGGRTGEGGATGRRWWLSSLALGLAIFSLLVLLHLSGGSPGRRPPPGLPGTSPETPSSEPVPGPATSARETAPLAALDPAQLLQEVKKAVVTLRFGQKLGSGFFIGSDGYLVTNAHVVTALTGTAQLSGGDTVEINLCSIDIDTDFALLKTAGGRGYPFLKLGDSSACREGDTVIAVGTPYSLQSTFTKGIISAKDRRLPGFGASLIQTDAAINHGNSGGPLINTAGEVVGINTMGYEKALAEGLNFAIAINEVKELIAEGQRLGETERVGQMARLEAKLREQAQKREAQEEQDKERIINARKEEERQNMEYAEEMRKYLQKRQERHELDLCLGEVDRLVGQAWMEQCQALSLPAGCRLPRNIANDLNGAYLKAQSRCLSYYAP
jgi:S1-C subfamily serine protease